MAQLNDLLVLGKANFLGNAAMKGSLVTEGLLSASGGIALDSSTSESTGLSYVLGIKAFADGGNVVWSSRANVSVGHADAATYLKDKGNGTATYVYYSSAGMESASWYGAWDGYTLRAIAPNKLATHLATNTLDARYVNITGDTMTGHLAVNPTDNTTSPTGQSIVLNGVTDSTDTGLAPGIGFHIGNKNWGSLKFLYDGSFRFYDSTCTGYKRIFSGGLTSSDYISLPTGAGINNASSNYISAGRGYSTSSGKNGLKILCTEQDDAISGIGQDCTGKSYELSIGAALGSSGQGYITFLGHKIDSLSTYSELGHFNFASSTFYVNGKVGIGNAAPEKTLTVNGTAEIGDNTVVKGLLYT